MRGLLSPRNARFCGENAGENNLASGQSGFILNTLLHLISHFVTIEVQKLNAFSELNSAQKLKYNP